MFVSEIFFMLHAECLSLFPKDKNFCTYAFLGPEFTLINMKRFSNINFIPSDFLTAVFRVILHSKKQYFL